MSATDGRGGDAPGADRHGGDAPGADVHGGDARGADPHGGDPHTGDPCSGDRVLGLAVSISDGADVDWTEEALHSPAREERTLIESLNVLARIEHLHRLERSRDLGAALPDAAPADLRLPDVARADLAPLRDQLEILEPLGAGSHGQVYRARDLKLQRDVALKILTARAPRGAPGVDEPATPAGRGAGLLREAQRLASVAHPNVVTVHGAQELDGGVALWMELVSGRTLAQIVREQGRMGAHEVLAIGGDLCRALAAVHRAGLLHQDVKADNVMREEGGRIVLMDFGPGAATPMYMAPELFEGAPASVRADLYSLGVLLYFLATAAYPVRGSTLAELRVAHARRSPVPLRDARPDLPAPLVRTVERALAHDPTARFSSAGELEQALAAASGAPAAAGAARAPLAWRQLLWPRRRAIAAAAGVVLLAGALGTWFAVRGHRRDAARSAMLGTQGEQPQTQGGADVSAVIGPYTAQAALYRGAQRRERLARGAGLGVGDSLSLEFVASASVYVYVIDEDEQGESYLLYPLTGVGPGNPLPAGVAHLLPGARDGRTLYWQVTSPGGREHVVILASPQRLVGFETEMLAVQRPQQGRTLQYARLTDRAKDELRGIGGVLEGPPSAAADPVRALIELARELPAGPEVAEGIWIRRIDLQNPAR